MLSSRCDIFSICGSHLRCYYSVWNKCLFWHHISVFVCVYLWHSVRCNWNWRMWHDNGKFCVRRILKRVQLQRVYHTRSTHILQWTYWSSTTVPIVTKKSGQEFSPHTIYVLIVVSQNAQSVKILRSCLWLPSKMKEEQHKYSSVWVRTVCSLKIYQLITPKSPIQNTQITEGGV